jgi:hypothetical protein
MDLQGNLLQSQHNALDFAQLHPRPMVPGTWYSADPEVESCDSSAASWIWSLKKCLSIELIFMTGRMLTHSLEKSVN